MWVRKKMCSLELQSPEGEQEKMVSAKPALKSLRKEAGVAQTKTGFWSVCSLQWDTGDRLMITSVYFMAMSVEWYSGWQNYINSLPNIHILSHKLIIEKI